jgi:hypothetical protein
MVKTLIAWIGFTALMALAPTPAAAQTNQAAAAAASGTIAIPNRATVRSGPQGSRTRHRNTLTRQKARATSEHARQVRASRQ